MSWPAGDGRREYFSAGCLGWLLMAPAIAVVYVTGFAAMAVLGAALGLAFAADAVWTGCRKACRRWHARRPGGGR